MGMEDLWRRVYVRMWRRGSFVRLSKMEPCGQGLWLFLLTCPESTQIPGAIVSGRAQLAEMLRWSQADTDECWAELEGEGMAEADWDARLIWLPNAPDANLPQSVNGAIGWGTTWKALPDCGLKERIAEEVHSALLRGGPKGSADAFLRAAGKLPGNNDDGAEADDTGARIVRSKERPEVAGDTVAWLRCRRGVWVELTADRVQHYQGKFPLTNVHREFTRPGGMVEWLEGVTESDRKDPGQARLWRFVANWLTRNERRAEVARKAGYGRRAEQEPKKEEALPTDPGVDRWLREVSTHSQDPRWAEYEAWVKTKGRKFRTFNEWKEMSRGQ